MEYGLIFQGTRTGEYYCKNMKYRINIHNHAKSRLNTPVWARFARPITAMSTACIGAEHDNSLCYMAIMQVSELAINYTNLGLHFTIVKL